MSMTRSLKILVIAVVVVGFFWGVDCLVSIVSKREFSLLSLLQLGGLVFPMLILRPRPWVSIVGASLCLAEVSVSVLLFLRFFFSVMDPLVFRVHFLRIEVLELSGFSQLLYCCLRGIVFLYSAAILLQAVSRADREPIFSRDFAAFLSLLLPGLAQAFQGRFLMVATFMTAVVIGWILIPLGIVVHLWAAIDAFRAHKKKWPIQPPEPMSGLAPGHGSS